VGGGGYVEAAGGGGGESVEILGYGVVDGGAGDADEVWEVLEKDLEGGKRGEESVPRRAAVEKQN
jgi:hypothetical protein